MKILYADVMELVDVPDSKSGVGNYVPVRPRPSAFLFYTRLYYENTKYTELSKFANLLCKKMNLPQKTTGSIVQPKTPLTDGLNTFGLWFAFGVGLDLVSRKCQFSKSPMKNSLAINGLIGAAAGLFAFYHDKKNS